VTVVEVEKIAEETMEFDLECELLEDGKETYDELFWTTVLLLLLTLLSLLVWVLAYAFEGALAFAFSWSWKRKRS
jgi:hypothetical protein